MEANDEDLKEAISYMPYTFAGYCSRRAEELISDDFEVGSEEYYIELGRLQGVATREIHEYTKRTGDKGYTHPGWVTSKVKK